MASRQLVGRERKFWAWALPNPPLDDEFDSLPTSALVQSLKRDVERLYAEPHGGRRNSSSNDNNNRDNRDRGNADVVWSQVSQMVRQLQEARKLVARLMDNAAGSKGRPQHGKFVPDRVDTSQLAEKWRRSAAYRLAKPPSPQVQPPSPLRVMRADFCGKDVTASLQAMARHKSNARVQQQACVAIVTLIKDGKKKRNAAALARPVSWTCATCTRENGLAVACCAACSVPRPEASEAASEAEERGPESCEGAQGPEQTESQQIEGLGGLTLIIDAMRAFPGNAGLLRAAAFALAQLVHEDSALVARVASAGGIGAVLDAMRALPSDAELQTQCMGVLASPELAEDAVVRIEGEAFAAVVCRALRGHAQSSRLQALGCLGLANLAVKSDSYTKLLVEDPAYEAHLLVIGLLHSEVHRANPHVAAAGMWALVALSRDLSDGSHTHVRDAITQAGAVEAAVRLLTRFPTHQSVQNNGKLLVARLGFKADDQNAADPDKGQCLLQ